MPLPYHPLTAAEIRQLLTAAKQGDRPAQESLVVSLTAFVVKVARKYSSRFPEAEYEDLVQVGLIGVHRSIVTFNPDKAARPGKSKARWKTYACAVAAKEVHRAAQAESRRVRAETLPIGDTGGDLQPQAVDQRGVPREVYRVRRALDRLPAKQRALVDAIHGITRPRLSIRLACRAAGVPSPQGRKLYRRGLAKLEAILKAA